MKLDRCMMNNECAPFLTSLLLFADHLFLSSFLPQGSKGSVGTLGRRPRLLCPVLQGAAPKLCPSPASTPISPSECASQSAGDFMSKGVCVLNARTYDETTQLEMSE